MYPSVIVKIESFKNAINYKNVWIALTWLAVVYILNIGWCNGHCVPGSKIQSDCRIGEELCLFTNWINISSKCSGEPF